MKMYQWPIYFWDARVGRIVLFKLYGFVLEFAVRIIENSMIYLERFAKGLAVVFTGAILVAAGIELVRMINQLYLLNISLAIQEGMFMLILLEMFYVVSFSIRKGYMNLALIISVGVVAVVKEVIFNLDQLDIWKATAFAVILVALALGIWLEQKSFLMRLEAKKMRRHNSLLKKRLEAHDLKIPLEEDLNKGTGLEMVSER